MLPALAARGHGVELTGVHRFRNDWEAAATLRLRQGDLSVIDTYARAGRLHTINQPDEAASAVFAHWQSAENEGTKAMMLARTRVDVDQLNALAKSAAQTNGLSHGPEVVIGELSLQAGDIIRTRRNNRILPLGESHVRNGDRYRVLATTEDGALLVSELTGRGSTVLPPSYVTEHVDHGWATTIDAAQGATTDIAILLVRPGVDREHLYVGLTRGRDENHAYIAPPAEDNDHHRAPAEGDIARRTLESLSPTRAPTTPRTRCSTDLEARFPRAPALPEWPGGPLPYIRRDRPRTRRLVARRRSAVRKTCLTKRTTSGHRASSPGSVVRFFANKRSM